MPRDKLTQLLESRPNYSEARFNLAQPGVSAPCTHHVDGWVMVSEDAREAGTSCNKHDHNHKEENSEQAYTPSV
jgi:hypothetical protein